MSFFAFMIEDINKKLPDNRSTETSTTKNVSYNDLTNKPRIPSVPKKVSSFENDTNYLTEEDITGKADKSDTYTKQEVDTALQNKANTSDLFSRDYNDLDNKPTIPTVPTNVSAFNNDVGYLTSHQSLSGYATEQWVTNQSYATQTWVGNQGYLTSHQDISGKVNTSDLATVATTGAYSDLTGTPTIPVLPTFATVATTGDYEDLINTPSIPQYVICTLAEYNAMASHDTDTYYIIIADPT